MSVTTHGLKEEDSRERDMWRRKVLYTGQITELAKERKKEIFTGICSNS